MSSKSHGASGTPGSLRANARMAECCAELLKAVAHPIRLRIVAILCVGEHSVTELSDLLEAKQAVVSQQLRILRMNGLVIVERRDGLSIYSLALPHLEVLVDCMEQCSAEREVARGSLA